MIIGVQYYIIIREVIILIEERTANIHINKAGGTAGETSKNYRISLPSSWMKKLEIDENNREVSIQFDGEAITIRKKGTTEYDMFRMEAKKMNHEVTILFFYSGDTLCTKICADNTAKKIAIKNETDDILLTAFGVNRQPTWDDYTEFLKERCIPETRDGIRFYLKELGLNSYEPLEIIRKTEGRMAEDNHHIRIVEG